MANLEITQTLKTDKFITPRDLLASGASFLLDKATPIVFTVLVGVGVFLIGVGTSLAALNLKVEHLETQAQAAVYQNEYEADQHSISLQLQSIKELIEQGNDRTERIEDYLLNR